MAASASSEFDILVDEAKAFDGHSDPPVTYEEKTEEEAEEFRRRHKEQEVPEITQQPFNFKWNIPEEGDTHLYLVINSNPCCPIILWSKEGRIKGEMADITQYAQKIFDSEGNVTSDAIKYVLKLSCKYRFKAIDVEL